MIRFCEKEVKSVSYKNINREIILSFFIDDHLDETICVVDINGNFKGTITYNSLIKSEDVYDAIIEDYVILNDDIWENAKQYFLQYKYIENAQFLLPVLNDMGVLLCFAYDDEGANREVRMLRELSNSLDALQFSDVYPEIKCVRIYGFNELAFLFSSYLSKSGVYVEIYDSICANFLCEEPKRVPDYECMAVYAEGIEGRQNNWREKLLKSVFVEFECIDIIYEKNIKQGIIKDTWEDIAALLRRLKNEEEIFILGTGNEAQDVYSFFLENEINVCGFVNNGESKKKHRMFGKSILNEFDVIKNYKHPIFIDCISQNSAWGIGKVNYFNYIGYERNKQYIVLKDYVQVTGNCLVKAISRTEVFLVGDIYLCKRLFDYMKKQGVILEGYLDMENQDDVIANFPRIDIDNVNIEMMCFIVIPEYFTPRNIQARIISQIETYLEKNGLINYSTYFSSVNPYIYIERLNELKYSKKELTPRRIVLGSIEGCCGNFFFRGLLDGHPLILMTNYNHVNDTLLNDNLFLLCVRLSVEEADNILPLFWKIYEEEDRNEICDPVAFNKKMKQLLGLGNTFTSQELFVAFHIAYMYMCGNDVAMTDISNMVLYWEPHFMARELLEECATCLNFQNVACDIINIVRNICMRNGAIIKGYVAMGWAGDKAIAYDAVLSYPSINKTDYESCDRLIVKFEDLKCKPSEILLEICRRWEIVWSDILLVTTDKGKQSIYNNGEREIKDFDLEPVYNTYEKYFSEFDRLRLMLINAPWQKKYGYPYEKASRFSLRELQEMFLKEFRFEKMIEYNGKESEMVWNYRKQGVIRDRLLKIRLVEFLTEEMV